MSTSRRTGPGGSTRRASAAKPARPGQPQARARLSRCLVDPPGHDGIGALVEVVTGAGDEARRQFREVQAGEGYLGAGDPRALFGLGSATEAARVTVRWPSGRVAVRVSVASDRYVTIEEEIDEETEDAP